MADPRENLTRLGGRLEGLLSEQRNQLRRRFLVHGIGWICAALLAALLVYYLADRALRLPVGVRVIASLGVLIYLVYGVRRRVLLPMRHQIGRDDVAVAFERLYPDLQERLISAVQLGDRLRASQTATADTAETGDDPRLRNQSEAMIAKVIEEAAQRVEALPPNRLLNPKRTLRVWAGAAALTVVVLLGTITQPGTAGVFLQRLLGLDVPYPRETTLRIQLPDNSTGFLVERRGDSRAVSVTMAAGGDLPVLVQAEGIPPREVFLMVEGGRGIPPQVAMTARGSGRFRHVFRRLTGDLTFHARGGDDDWGDLEVTVSTLHPPRVANIRTQTQPPAYTGAPAVTHAGGSLEALEGSSVDIVVTPTSEVASARLVFLESGLSIDLDARTVEDDSGTRTVHAGSFVVTKSDRYQVELLSREGLQNPHPGIYPVVALADHAPIGRVLLPVSDDLNVVLPTAVLPLRIEVKDDYGIAAAQVHFDLGKEDKTGSIDLYTRTEGQPPPQRIVFTELLPLDKLPIPDATVSVGDTIALAATLTDIKMPEAMTTDLPTREIFVVGEGDLARRISGHFRRIRDDVDRAYSLQTDRHDRLAEILESLADGKGQDDVQGELAIVQVGQARLLSLGKRVRDELIRSFNLHLFNGLEASPHATTVQQLFLEFHRADDTAVPSAPAFYTMIAAKRRDGSLGSMPKTLDPILAMIGSAANVAETLSPLASKLLDRAAVERSSQLTATTLDEARKTQESILTELLALRNRLDEWNEFQDVISQTRTLRDGQRDLHSRTKETLKGAGK